MGKIAVDCSNTSSSKVSKSSKPKALKTNNPGRISKGSANRAMTDNAGALHLLADAALADAASNEFAVRQYLLQQYQKNGRFDQQDITNNLPEPKGDAVSALDALCIVADVILTIEGNNNQPAKVLTPYRTGGKWSEFEYSCLIQEFALLQHAWADHRRGEGERPYKTGTLFAYVSKQLNDKYGIDRSKASVKNEWYRKLRQRTGIDERADFREPSRRQDYLGAELAVSLGNKSSPSKGTQGSKRRKAPVKSR
ncbi:hypothetical protein BT63DRAFT_408992 [Microthyrium microscopicum]|uniref:Myb-like domain-containing protein n=1 Tax=Microthyrium microscopicum TaxID=703497 RepID=A0A6A6URB2_9PEZI|nr:hypothetical protein BT63DRAFT_408992 [Microthyrium microscopicum]